MPSGESSRRRERVLSRYALLLSDRRLGAYYTGQFISWVGDWAGRVALLAITFRLTGSILAVALVFVAEQLPKVILPLAAGGLIERCDRRRLLLFCDGARLLLCLLLVAGALRSSLLLIYGAAFPLLALSALYSLVRTAMLPALLPRRHLLTANAFGFTLFSVATVVGAAVGGAVIASQGEAAAFGLNALSYLAAVGAILILRLPPLLPLEQPQSTPASTARRLFAAWETVSRRGIIRTATLLMLLIVFASGALQVLFPLTASTVLPWGRAGTGYLYSALALGAVAGILLSRNLLIPAVIPHDGPYRTKSEQGYVSLQRTIDRRLSHGRRLSLVLALAGLSLAAFVLVETPAALLVCAAVFGLSTVTAQAAAAAVIQEKTGVAFLGRLFALRQILIGATALAGSLSGALLVAVAGRVHVIAAVAAVLLFAGLGQFLLSSRQRIAEPSPALGVVPSE